MTIDYDAEDEPDLTALLDATPLLPADLEELHRRLEQEAARAGLVDIAYTDIDTPVGALLLAATDTGLVRVAYEREGFDTVLGTLATRISPRLIRVPSQLSDAARQIDEYFSGTRKHFDLALDYRLSHGFRQQVQRHLPSIGYGHTQSYKQVAQLLGNPNAVRAVGTACATNPLPVVVPCHRVLRTDGSLGGYIGGLDTKTLLLNLEGAA